MASMVPEMPDDGVDEACGDRVEVLDFELGAEGSEGCVLRIDGTCVAVERDGSVAGEVGGDGEGERLVEGEVFRFEVELVVGAFGSGGGAGSGFGRDVERCRW